MRITNRFYIKIHFYTLFTFLTTAFSLVNSQTTYYTQSGGTATLSNKTYTASTTDQSGVLVSNSGVLYLSNSSIKTTGNTSSQDNSSFYGQNAAVLATSSAKITLTGSIITSSGTGANGAFAYGSGSTVILINDTITCTAQGGHGAMCSGGGTMTLTDVIITTGPGANSAPIATDRGSGTITVTGGKITATGTDAPGIYSTGKITVTGAVINSTGAEAAAIEGANYITLINTTISGTKKRGVLMYQSMSGDADGTIGTFTMTGGSLSQVAGPLFYVTNATAIINLNGAKLTASSGTFIQAASDSWGTSGKNGGNAKLTAIGQTMVGNIIIDKYSTFTGILSNSSTLTGAINNAQTAKSTSLKMDASSTWILTANSYLDTISNSAGISGTTVTNITGNGYNVYYNSSLTANSYLGGKTYSLVNGGYLMPTGTTSIKSTGSLLPSSVELSQNYPNPFNPSTTISFGLPEASYITLKIFDALGKEAASLANDLLNAGYHNYTWNAGSYASGTYFYRLTSRPISGNNNNTVSTVKKLVLSK
jgi:hypothetical protein